MSTKYFVPKGNVNAQVMPQFCCPEATEYLWMPECGQNKSD